MPELKAVGAGATTRLELDVELLAPLVTGVFPEMFLDLSALGAEGERRFAHDGEGRYTLRHPVIPPRLGRFDLPVLLATGEEPPYLFFTVPLFVYPEEDLRIFDDAVGDGWRIDAGGGADPPMMTEEGPVYRGTASLAFRVKPASFVGWQVDFSPPQPIEPSAYDAVRFAFHPGDAGGGGLNVKVGDQSVSLLGRNRLEGIEVDLGRKEWQIVEIPLSRLTLTGLIEQIGLQGNLEGMFYTDDWRLVSGWEKATAVAAESVMPSPGAVVLAQNYPNPFNRETVIPFRLPFRSDVELSLFNAVGQRVVTLVNGYREAGVHRVRWDGRDSRGLPVASGLYLYRLQVGSGEEMRTLLLLR